MGISTYRITPHNFLHLMLAVAVLTSIICPPVLSFDLQAPWDKGDYWHPMTYNEHSNLGTQYALDWHYATSIYNSCPYATWGNSAGRRIRAAHAGKVVFASLDYSGYGNLVRIRNGDYESYYGHLSDISVSCNQSVQPGDVIGHCGNTGNSTGPHLHFELRKNGIRQRIDQAIIDGQSVGIDYGCTNANGWYMGHTIYALHCLIDKTSPSISLAPGVAGGTGWYTSSQNISWTIKDNAGGSGFSKAETWWNSEKHKSVGATGNTTMRSGSNTFHVKAWDIAGNVTQLDRIYKLDAAVPSITVTTPQPSYAYNAPQVVKWNVTDTASGFSWVKVQWDTNTANQFLSASGSLWVPDDDAPHIFKISACDKAGNTTQWYTYGPFIVDVEAPHITFQGPQERSWIRNAEQVIWAVAGASGVTLRWDSGIADPVSLGGGASVPEGVHSATLSAVDQAGNTATTGGEYWIDLHAPVFVADSLVVPAESGSLNILSATWQFIDTVPPDVNQVSGITEYEYWIGTMPGEADASSPLSTTEPWAWATNLHLEDGATYYITVRARDAAGNWSEPVTSDGIVATDGPSESCAMTNAGGTSTDVRSSAGMLLTDTIGQFAIGESTLASGWIEHGYWHADSEVSSSVSIPSARLLADGASVVLGAVDDPVVVTVPTPTFTNQFYVEQNDRVSGMVVEYDPNIESTLHEGDQVWVRGRMKTDGHQRMLTAEYLSVVGHQNSLAPFFLKSSSLGGIMYDPSIPSISSSSGPYNVGLLVKISGRVNAVDPLNQFFYIDDGAGLTDGVLINDTSAKGIRVSLAGLATGNVITAAANGTYVSATGVVSVYEHSGRVYAQIRPRTQSDIELIQE